MQPQTGITAREISVGDLKIRMSRGEEFIFVDARNPGDWSASEIKVAGAIRVPPAEVDQHLKTIPSGRPIVVY